MTFFSFFLSTFPSLLLLCILLPSSSLSLSSSTDAPWQDAAIRAATAIKDAQSVLFVTGAGISAKSGPPPIVACLVCTMMEVRHSRRMECRLKSVSVPGVFCENPKLTWKYLLQVERACRGAQPSQAHVLLARAEQCIPRVAVFTQNVDGLHHRAGSKNVLSLHGNVHELVCSKCGATQIVETFAHLDQHAPIPPKCDTCGGIVDSSSRLV